MEIINKLPDRYYYILKNLIEEELDFYGSLSSSVGGTKN